MGQLILKTIDHAKYVSKGKVSLESILQKINKTSTTNLDNKTLKLELDQMIVKGLIDQNYKILHSDRMHLENLPSPEKVNFTLPNENGNNTEERQTQETPLTELHVSFSNSKSETPLVLNNQKESAGKHFSFKIFFMNEIYDLKQESSSVGS